VLAALKTALEGGGALDVALPAGTPSGDALDTEALDHGAFARAANGRVWGLLENDARTDDDAREMVDAAHASLWHWRYGGELVHEQRGEWLVSRVYAVLGDGTAAMLHARRCLDLTEQGRLDGFDAVYAAEAMARALAASGRDTEAREWRERALVAATKIDDPEDREIVAGDLAVGPWYGIA
jgi:hypothetical protein